VIIENFPGGDQNREEGATGDERLDSPVFEVGDAVRQAKVLVPRGLLQQECPRIFVADQSDRGNGRGRQ